MIASLQRVVGLVQPHHHSIEMRRLAYHREPSPQPSGIFQTIQLTFLQRGVNVAHKFEPELQNFRTV